MNSETPTIALLRAARSFYTQALDAPTEGEAFELYLAADEITNALDRFYIAHEAARLSRPLKRRLQKRKHSMGHEGAPRPQPVFGLIA